MQRDIGDRSCMEATPRRGFEGGFSLHFFFLSRCENGNLREKKNNQREIKEIRGIIDEV